MSFPRYPAYKPSGVEWLGEVPEHWGMGQSRRRFRLRNEPARDEDEQLTASQKYGVIKQADFVESEGRRVVEVIKGQDILKHVEPGDFVISMRSFQGGLEFSRVRGCISSAYVMLAPVKQVIPEFFSWLFKSQPYIQALQSTTNLVRDGQALRFSNFCQVDIPIIPANEQIAIVTFLDRETAKIDALIAEQQRLIELLQEKRQAVISHAVTKGLDPDAPMKDSGVEWLGEVPEHWSIGKLSYVADVIDPNPSHRNPVYTDNGYPFISTVEFRPSGKIQFDTTRRVAEETVLEQEGRCRFGKGSLAFSRKGTIGAVRELPTGLRFALLDSLCVINPSSACASDFLRLYFASAACSRQLEFMMRGAALLQVSVGDVRRIILPCPSAQEQHEIVNYLLPLLARFDMLIEISGQSGALLAERRSALISAAVTGQIDVRGVAPEADAA